jgi:hypothetical protein
MKLGLVLSALLVFPGHIRAEILASYSGGGANPTLDHFTLNYSGHAEIGPANDNGLNVWSIDNTAGADVGIYTYDLSSKADMLRSGWAMEVQMRLAKVPTASSAGPIARFYTGENLYSMEFGANAAGDMTLRFQGANGAFQSFVSPGGALKYQTYTLLYDPAADSATLRIDGVQRLSGITGVSLTSSPRFDWGAGQDLSHSYWLAARLHTLPEPDNAWIKTAAPAASWSRVACSADATKIVALRGYSTVILSSDSGKSWTTSNVPSIWCESVASSADGTKLAVASWKRGPICVSVDSGLTWRQTSAPMEYWSSIASSADGSTLLAAASDSYNKFLYVSTDYGTNWIKTGPSNHWNYVATSADGTRMVATARNGIYKSSDAGTTWQKTSASTNSWGFIASSADGSKLIVVEDWIMAQNYHTSVYLSQDAGQTWIRTALATNVVWTSVASSADGTKLIAVGWDNSLFTSTDAGASWWRDQAPGASLEPVWHDAASSADGTRLIAAGQAIWRLETAQTPALKITSAGDAPLISWTLPGTDFVLEQNSALSPDGWTEVLTTPSLSTATLEYRMVLSPATHPSNLFYRLRNK